MTNESWKPCPLLPSRFVVSDQGRVKNSETGYVMKLHNNAGYRRISVRINGKINSFGVHLLVMSAFVGPLPKGYHTNHLDGKRDDNRLENLEYTTPSGNASHAYKLGLRKPQKGDGNHHAKLNRYDVAQIRWLLSKKQMKHREIGERYGVSRMTISAINNGRLWK